MKGKQVNSRLILNPKHVGVNTHCMHVDSKRTLVESLARCPWQFRK